MQLVELLVSVTISSLLLLGLASSLSTASLMNSAVSRRTNGHASAHRAVQLLRADMNDAISTTNRTSTSVVLKVQDRDGDSEPDLVAYRWSATTGPLETSIANGPWTALTPDLKNVRMTWQTCEPASREPTVSLDPSGRVLYHSLSVNAQSNNTRNLTILSPPGYLSGEACVAVVTMNSNTGNVQVDSAWTKLFQTNLGNSLTMAAWITSNAPTQSQFSWGSNASALGAVIHLKGASATAPYVNSANAIGAGHMNAPAVSGTHTNESVLRVLGGIGSGTFNNSPSVTGHTAVYFGQLDLNNSTQYLTLAIATQQLTGNSIPAATFQFSPGCSSSCAATIALRP